MCAKDLRESTRKQQAQLEKLLSVKEDKRREAKRKTEQEEARRRQEEERRRLEEERRRQEEERHRREEEEAQRYTSHCQIQTRSRRLSVGEEWRDLAVSQNSLSLWQSSPVCIFFLLYITHGGNTIRK